MTMTFLADLASQSAAAGPSAKSLGMTRCQVLKPWSCSVPLLADGFTIEMPASPYLPATACVAPEKDGPTTPITFEFWMTWAAAAGALAGSPTSSARTSLSLKPRLESSLAWSTASSAPLTSLMPSWALSPERGPSKAIV